MRITGGSRRKARKVAKKVSAKAQVKKPIKGRTIIETMIDRRKATEEAIAAFRRRR